MLNFVTRAFSENRNANPSTMRLGTQLMVLAIKGGWLANTVNSWTSQALSPEQVALVLGALAAKGWQESYRSFVQLRSANAERPVFVGFLCLHLRLAKPRAGRSAGKTGDGLKG